MLLGVFFAFLLTARPTVSKELLRPRYARVEFAGIGGKIETVWQRPHMSHAEPKGIFFIAHGCNHQGTDIFSNTGHDGHVFSECTSTALGGCLGLPEEIRLREAARDRGYLVMAVSSTGNRRCWDMDIDVARVVAAVRHVQKVEHISESSPVLATGASSGGAFVGRLAAPVAAGGLPFLRCIVPQIMGVHGAPNRGVPALFVHMPRDIRTSRQVQSDMAELRAKSIRTAEIRVEPVPVTADLLKPCLGDLAEEAVRALREVQWLLDDEGYLQQDARHRLWVEKIRNLLKTHNRADSDTLEPDESCMAEVMNVAWAQHEFTSQYAKQMLDFCDNTHDEL